MASLKEIKGRINSVKSTLKITSAMKMVSSAKLRKAQSAIENMLPYERTLQEILMSVRPEGMAAQEAQQGGRVAVVAVSSNSSLCGSFNANVIREALAFAAGCESVEIYPVGRKMADAVRRAGYECEEDLSELIGAPAYESASALASRLVSRFQDGLVSRVVLIYNHFVSTASQKVLTETYLPFDMSAFMHAGEADAEQRYILEPDAQQLVEELLPKVIRLKLYTVMLDSAAAEHSARTMAMQTATDNGEDILQELSLEYNKGRQQKITSEILDIVGGSMQ